MPARPRRTPVAAAWLLALALPPSRAEEPAPEPQKPIVVTAPRAEDYAPLLERLGLTGRSVIETPASATIIPRALLDEQGARGLLSAVGYDASVGENYAPLGYYEALSIRGFVLDGASGYKRNGLSIGNESSMPLENKERVEILKGVAGFEAGLAAPGGVINYVTKRPTDAPARRVELAYGERGTRYAAADAGGRLGAFGYRLNFAREDYHPYVREAVGTRDFAGAVLDWRLGEDALVALDADWQRKSQLSVPGYQALGGAALPPNVRPETMLNNQPWSQPVAIEASNLGGRFSVGPGEPWRLELAGNRNRTLSEDKAAFPFGCSSGPTYLTTFCANGDYDLYDYRSSGEIRTVTHVQATLSGQGEAAGLRHEAALGLSRLTRVVDLGQEVYDFVGTDNIYNPSPLVFAPSPAGTGDVHRNQVFGEQALFARDAVSLAPAWKLHAGLRALRAADDHFRKSDGAQVSRYRRDFVLPQAALAFSPRPDASAYAAYSQGLELGSTADVTTANAGEILPPKLSRQVELGVKREVGGRFLASAALFHIWKPYEFVDPADVLVQRGTVRHSGLELSASGRLTEELRLVSSLAMIHARQSGTGVPAFEGRAPVNIPRLRSQATLDWSPGRAPGLGLNATWARSESKYALRDGSLKVPPYNRLDLGARYAMRAGPVRLTWRLRVENVLDALYWKDVGEYFGDGYLHLGAPRTYRASLQLDF